MDLNAFREEARDWLESNCPQAMRLGAVHFEDAYELYQTDEALEWRDRSHSRLDGARMAHPIRRRWFEPRTTPGTGSGNGADKGIAPCHRNGPGHDWTDHLRVGH